MRRGAAHTVRSSELFLAADQPRHERRRLRRAAQQIRADAIRVDQEAERDRRARIRAEQRERHYLPPGGERGAAALRSYRRFKLPAHRATSAVLSYAYPFLAEAGLGARGILIGRDTYSGGSFVYDPWVLYRDGVLTNPNVLLAGVIGTGKSALAKSLVCRSLAFGVRTYVPGDPKGEWTAVAEQLGGQAIRLGPGLATRLNPLDAGRRPPDVQDRRWDDLVWLRRRELLGSLTESVLGRALQPTEHTALDAALSVAARAASTPTLPMVVAALLDPPADDAASTAEQLQTDGRAAAHALRRLVHGDLAGLFDGPSTVAFDPELPMVTLDLSMINGSDTLLSLVMTCASAWMESALLDPNGGRRWVVYDEAWRIMRHAALIRRMQSQWKLSRAYGIANLMIIHRLSDLDAVGDASSEARALASGLLADCSTRIVYRQESDQLNSTAAMLGLTSTERAILPELGIGEGLWRIRDRAFRVQHQMTPAEMETFDTTERMLAS